MKAGQASGGRQGKQGKGMGNEIEAWYKIDMNVLNNEETGTFPTQNITNSLKEKRARLKGARFLSFFLSYIYFFKPLQTQITCAFQGYDVYGYNTFVYGYNTFVYGYNTIF